MGSATQHSSGGVFVSLETIYQEQKDTQKQVQGLRDEVRDALGLEKRVRELEASRASQQAHTGPAGTPTTAAAVTALLAAAGTALWQLIGG